MGKKPLRILSIDDDLGCRLAAARFLTLTGGHIVEAAEDGRDGLRKAAALKPDIILLDLRMPGMNGLEVMEALCAGEATRDIPVIMITAASLSDSERECLEAKPNFRLLEQKPADFREILKKIEMLARSGAARPAAGGTVTRDAPEPA